MAKRFGAVAWPTAICAVAAAGTLLTQHGAGAGAMPFAAFTLGNLLTGAASSALHEISKVFGEGFLDQLFDRRPGIDENHVVLRELRHAQLDALILIRQEFDNGWKWNAGVDQRTKRRSERVSKALASFIDEQSTDQAILSFAKFQSESGDEVAIRDAVRQSLTRSFDKGLAARHATAGDTTAQQQTNAAITETFEKLRAITEAAVLTEFQRTISPKKDEPPEDAEEDPLPTTFRELFAGTKTKNGWFDLYLRAAAERLKTLKGKNPGQFEKIWQAEQAAITRAILETQLEILNRVDKRTESMARDLADLKAGLLAMGFDPNLARELEAERNKYRMTVEAVIKELGRVSPESITPDSLIGQLGAVFTQYLAVKEALARPANDVPAISRLKQQAIAALDSGNLDHAERLLNEVLQHERREAEERRSDWLAALMRQAESYAMLGRIALARRNLADAVQKFQSGANELAPADSETRWSYTLKAADALLDFGDAAGDNTALTAAISLYMAALKDAPRDRVPLDWAITQNNLGIALSKLGDREAGAARLKDAVQAYHAALEERRRDRVPLDWAMTQNNLGIALAALGAREGDMARLKEAVKAYRAALQERRKDRVPLDWAMTQNNLGIALAALGAREGDIARLKEAVKAYRAALQERRRDRVPLYWAMTQNNLGNALRMLGERESGTAYLKEAVEAFRAALEERRQDRVPLDWAMTQNNLGIALATLGERERGAARLEEAVEAYRAALQERRQDRVPLAWAMTQNNLGIALATLGSREAGTARLEEAVAAYRAALREYTQDCVPLNWAMTQNNLGIALKTLGERESGTTRLEEAVAAYQAALQERRRDRVPPAWAQSQYNLANALAVLAGRQKSAPQMAEALTCMKNAVDGYTQCGDNYRLPIAQARVTEIESALAALQT